MTVSFYPQNSKTTMKTHETSSYRDGDAQWQRIYRAGGLAALFIVLAGMVDIFIMFIPGTGTIPGSRTAIDWFMLFQHQPFLALRDLGLLNLITVSCSVLVFFALCGILRNTHSASAVLALVLLCIGTTVYLANNIALPMFNLSNQFSTAITASQKSILINAAQTLLSQEDISAGSFIGFFIPESAGILMGLIMLQSKNFNPWTCWIGIAGEACLLIFNICAAFIPALFEPAMIFAMIGGPLSMIWFLLIAIRLFTFENESLVSDTQGRSACQA